MDQLSTANQIFITSWPPSCSSEASASYSQSASSAIISPACEAQCESSAHTDSSPLKEHDYIGLAEISSSASFHKSEQKPHVYLVNDDDDEPDLRLGLGPYAAVKGACGDGSLHTIADLPKRDVAKDASTCSNSSMKRPDAKLMCFASVDSSAKSAKRSFSDTIVIPEVRLVAGEDMKSGVVLTTGQVRRVMQMPDVDTKSLSKHSQKMVYWTSPPVSSWHPELTQTTGSFAQLASGKLLKNNSDCAPPSGNLVVRNLEPVSDDAPPAKEQVVGWPPIRSYRRSAIAVRSTRPVENQCDVQSAIYVKVNMDGIPIGRKVDLNAYSSYEELRLALEGMFHSPHIGENVRFLHARDFVLTYEDQEGDWMLVGDVPWSMFVNTVKRLRIMRGSDPNCLASSTSKNFS